MSAPRTYPDIDHREGGAFAKSLRQRSEDNGIVEQVLRRGRTTQPGGHEQMTSLATSNLRIGSNITRKSRQGGITPMSDFQWLRKCFILSHTIKKFIIPIILFLSCTNLFAQESSSRSLKSIELLSGFGKSKLRDQGNYYLTPVIFDLDFDLNPILKNKGINLPGLFEFQLEPFISIVDKPDSNIEVGNTFILKLGILPETFKFQPYIKAGPGLFYMSQHTREQATQFNFLEQAGVGFHYFFNKNLAITVDWRLRHISNAAIKQPNKGINGRFYLLGLTYRF